jgi:hypothetical protein
MQLSAQRRAACVGNVLKAQQNEGLCSRLGAEDSRLDAKSANAVAELQSYACSKTSEARGQVLELEQERLLFFLGHKAQPL